PPERGRGGVEVMLLSRTDRQLAAHLAERLGHLESDAARSARHQRNLSTEIKQLARLHGRSSLPIYLPTGPRYCDRGGARTRRRSQGRAHGIWSSFGMLSETSRTHRR